MNGPVYSVELLGPGLTLDDPIWDEARSGLWARIEAHDFEPNHALNFTARLVRDRSWTLAEARDAIDAYRRFFFLAAVSAAQVTPSEAVDEVWLRETRS